MRLIGQKKMKWVELKTQMIVVCYGLKVVGKELNL
jgi:hypothetical protein